MRVIVLASQKGGAGKTTLAAHLAVAAEAAGAGPAVLMDMDPQGSLSAWWNARETPAPALAPAVLADLPAKLASLGAAGFKLAILDTPPAIGRTIAAVIATADLVLIPVRPSPHDLRAVGSTVDLARAAGRPLAFILSQGKPQSRLALQASAALSEHGAVAPAMISDRVDYAASMTDGRTVLETDPRGRSAAEIRGLWAFVADRLSPKARKVEKQYA